MARSEILGAILPLLQALDEYSRSADTGGSQPRQPNRQEVPADEDPDVDLPGGGGTAPVFREGPDGRVYQWDGDSWVATEGMEGDEVDPEAYGLVPLDEPPIRAGGSTTPQFTVPGRKSPWYADPQSGLIFDRKGELAPNSVQERFASRYGGGGSDPETARHNRVSEAQAAMNALAARIDDAQRMRLAGAEWALPPGAQNFPGFGPNSPAVRLGLAEALPTVGVNLDPDRALKLLGGY
jgi:hypothetical protein